MINFLKKIPPFKQLGMSFGVQRFMLMLGLVILTSFILVAVFADLIAPFHFAQLQ